MRPYFSHTCQISILQTWGRGVYLDSDIDEVFIDNALHRKARQLFIKLKSKNISFIDCSSVIAMKTEKIKTAFSFDAHFKKLGVELLTLNQQRV